MGDLVTGIAQSAARAIVFDDDDFATENTALADDTVLHQGGVRIVATLAALIADEVLTIDGTVESGGSAPVNTVAPVVSQPNTSPNYGSKLFCDGGTFDDPLATKHYAWMDTDENPLPNDPGDNAYYTLNYDGGDYPGMMTRCKVYAHNAAGDSVLVSSNDYMVTTIAPHCSVAPLVTTSVAGYGANSSAIGSTLTRVNFGTWVGGFPSADSVDTQFQPEWHGSGNIQDPYADTYDSTDDDGNTDRGQTIYNEVVCYHPEVNSNPVSSNSFLITGSPFPSNEAGVHIAGGNPRDIGVELTCSNTTWVSSPAATSGPDFQWYTNDPELPIAGQTTNKHTTTEDDSSKGGVKCQISYTNPVGTTSVFSNSIDVSPP